MSIPTIPTVEDFTSDVIVDRYDDMINPPGLTNHLATAQADHDVVAVRSLNVPPVSQGDCVTGQLYLGGRLARSYGEAVEVQWRPDQVLRRTRIDDWQVHTTTVCPPGEAGIIVRIDVTNDGAQDRELRLGLWIDSTVTRSGEPWLAGPPPQAANSVTVDGARRVGRPDDGSAVSVQGLVDGSGRDVTDANGTARMIEARVDVPAGQRRTFAYLHVIGGGEAEVTAAYERIAADVPGAVAAARTTWDANLAAMFTPGNTEFGGNLPVLVTGNDALRRLYWWGAMGVLWFRRDNPASVLGRTYDTLMPRYWQTTTFIWDYSLSSYVHALLDPDVMRRQIAHWVGLDIDHHYGTEWLTGGPVGRWYSVNHYAMTRLVNDYLRLHGDDGFLDEKLTSSSGQTRSLADHVRYWATAWQGLRSASGLADYGKIDNLLECVSTYVHEVASLNAANVWNMRAAAEISEFRGQRAAADELRTQADELLNLVNELYVPGKGYFHTRQPDGSLVECRHCYDFATVGTTVGADLPARQRDEMVRFFVEELRTPAWMRALSPWDEDAGYSVRADHQWNGAYPAWPPEAARAAITLGHPEVVLEWLPGLAGTANQGPPGQAHFVEEAIEPINGGARKTPPQLPYIIDWSCSSAGSWCELVLAGIFGLEVDLDGGVRAGGCIADLDPNARLEGLVVQGRRYDVIGGDVVPSEW
ncbi:hypothetical protein EF847_14445 [Actinobacteria bacterium YIM 96077]|uniref:Alpha-L-rhamnosidase six-hairpin glycosidase domain-containing protein n=1 Tax=Phytoactinopolyspora halophila TaxID=1981511 RepID=A0A329QDM8_9ACTN|nr:hypothetical protein [Phytoactinopolyspora halophila]AYY13716.1 hypothetical protein EF847_14445 [Actinobacteria bacterium YIM 96077]RAW09352.1 hypothetical protein DPM12_21495 [Phytoactinopolyspora halophila]